MRPYLPGIAALALALLLTGCGAAHRKSKQEAIERWQFARAQITTDLARGQFEGGQLDKAAQSCRKALSLAPAYAPAHRLLGQV